MLCRLQTELQEMLAPTLSWQIALPGRNVEKGQRPGGQNVERVCWPACPGRRGGLGHRLQCPGQLPTTCSRARGGEEIRLEEGQAGGLKRPWVRWAGRPVCWSSACLPGCGGPKLLRSPHWAGLGWPQLLSSAQTASRWQASYTASLPSWLGFSLGTPSPPHCFYQHHHPSQCPAHHHSHQRLILQQESVAKGQCLTLPQCPEPHRAAGAPLSAGSRPA